MVFYQWGENSLELVIMNRMGQIIGLVLICRVEMESNILTILRLYCITVYWPVTCSNSKLQREENEEQTTSWYK